MSNFESLVQRLEIKEHPNADSLELAMIGDYHCIVPKGQFKTGDWGVHIPEQAIVPGWILKKMNLEGKLAGKDKNRVKAIKLRGALSQGIIYPVQNECVEIENGKLRRVKIGVDVSNLLGIKKYNPPIPIHMAGQVKNAGGITLKYDIENIKKYPTIIREGESVVFTEKLHGTWTCLGYHPDLDHALVTSKGLSSRGLIFKTNKENENNLYIRSLKSTINEMGNHVIDRLRIRLMTNSFFGLDYTVPVYILGETFGKGVQDLDYGFENPQFRVFDIYVGDSVKGRYLNHAELQVACHFLGISTVPILYIGEFNKGIMEKFTEGQKTSFGQINVREGIVIKPLKERTNSQIGRVILKNVSSDYLTRGGKATEYQ